MNNLDFSRTSDDLIRTYVDRVKTQLANNPNADNAAELRAYIAAGESELQSRTTRTLMLAGVGLLVLLSLAN